jgi:hypothetical protein
MLPGRTRIAACRAFRTSTGAVQWMVSFHIVGYFDTIEEMHKVYDCYKGHTALSVDETGWRLWK